MNRPKPIGTPYKYFTDGVFIEKDKFDELTERIDQMEIYCNYIENQLNVRDRATLIDNLAVATLNGRIKEINNRYDKVENENHNLTNTINKLKDELAKSNKRCSKLERALEKAIDWLEGDCPPNEDMLECCHNLGRCNGNECKKVWKEFVMQDD